MCYDSLSTVFMFSNVFMHGIVMHLCSFCNRHSLNIHMMTMMMMILMLMNQV